MEESHFWSKHIRRSAVLSATDRISEILFGLIMVLTFTGTISVSSDGQDEIRQLLWAALGCNLAWGFVDAIMYLMNILIERGRGIRVIRKIIQSGNAGEKRKILRDELPHLVTGLLDDDAVDSMVLKLRALPVPSFRNILTSRDFLSALEIFFLVFFCTFPVALPFSFVDDTERAMRISNAIALVLMFICGYLLARYAGFRPILTALAYTAIGVLLVVITMLLGG